MKKPKTTKTTEKKQKLPKNKATVTGGIKYVSTPDYGRLFVNVEKKKLKELKKIAIDLEIPIDDILLLAVDVFIHNFNHAPLDEFEKKGAKIFFR